MDRFDRIFAIHKILSSSRYPVSRREIQKRIECSRATFSRIIEDMRDYLNAPVVYDKKYNGYKYDGAEGEQYELPGLWFNQSEILSLLACQQLLKSVQPGLLDKHIKPVSDRIKNILAQKQTFSSDLVNRIRILKSISRKIDESIFNKVADSLAKGRRVDIIYHGRERNADTTREVSPQRLIHYRDNWYLDAWCHMRKGLRSFSLDRIVEAEFSDKKSRAVSDKKLDEHFASSYGIFAGKPKDKVRLRFSKEISKWVAKEEWHPEQRSRVVNEMLELTFPFSDQRELARDILQYGSDVEVVEPKSLRKYLGEELKKTLKNYEKEEQNNSSINF